MGVCASRQDLGCHCFSSSLKKQRKDGKRSRRRKRTIKRRVSSEKMDRHDLVGEPDRSYSNPAVQGNSEGPWADAISVLESEKDDEFYSVHEDVFSVVGSETASMRSTSSPRGCSKTDYHENSIPENLVGVPPNDENPVNAQLRDENTELKRNGGGQNELITAVSADEMSSVYAGGDGNGLLNCGILPSNCLPCLNASSVPALDKKQPISPVAPLSRRMPSLKLPFRWREGQATPLLASPKEFLRRPVAGSSIAYCPMGKNVANSWSVLEPGTFKVRGQSYHRDRKKDFAPNHAAYYPFGADLFLSQRKIPHIARFVDLPQTSASDEAPAILVVNAQLPVYSPALFQSEYDGEGVNLVMYFKLSESYSKDLPLQFRENMSRFINDEVERVKGFPMDSIAPFRERLKILARLANVDDVPLSMTERKVLHAYYDKPLMTRPQHEFYLGENYFEIDIDMHRYCYLARRGLDSIRERLKLCVMDFGLTIQGSKAEDLPEHVLCCLRLSLLEYTKYLHLEC